MILYVGLRYEYKILVSNINQGGQEDLSFKVRQKPNDARYAAL